MNDYLIKALAFDGQIRAFAVNATETVSEAQRRHDTWHSSSAALGRSLVGGLLLGSQLKGDDKLTVKIEGNGPGGLIMVDANGKGEVKGYITNPHVALELNDKGKIDVRGVVGTEGSLTVIKDLGMKEPFSGQVPLVSGELGEDFTYYLANSEQVPSAVGLSVLVDTDDCILASGGFMIQVMPGATDETLDEIERRLSEIPFVSRLIEQGEQPETILNRLLGEENVQILDKMPVSFQCNCSKDRFGAMLMTLGVSDLEEIIEEDHGAETVCHFCNEHYHFSEDDLKAIVSEIQAAK